MISHRRPLVIVEDHLFHIGRLLDLLGRDAPELLERLWVVCLDSRGPDTQAAVDGWLAEYPKVQIVADADVSSPARQQALEVSGLRRDHDYARLIHDLLAPGGLLVQDIQLETLRFVSAEKWWETIFLANMVRGMYANRPPQCLFFSNKRGFHATFGRDLLEVGFDPRDVLHKDELDEALVPLLRQRLRDAFPLEMWVGEVDGTEHTQWLTGATEEEDELANEFDLIIWDHRAAKLGLSGRVVGAHGRAMVEIGSKGPEAQTWRDLVEARIEDAAGVPTRELGERVAPDLALPPEQGAAANRHIWNLRKRLGSADAVITVDHHYALAQELRVGWVRRRDR